MSLSLSYIAICEYVTKSDKKQLRLNGPIKWVVRLIVPAILINTKSLVK